MSNLSKDETARGLEDFRKAYERIRQEIGRVIVGQSEVVEGVLVAFFSGGHVLLEGVPGLGKTMLVRALADSVNLPFSRIQFTPDLMPADIVGTTLILEDEAGRKTFQFQKGPVFANILLADEINRATPKTQSALLEAMQENQVTIAGKHYPLEPPFIVLATQNPLEMEGTYSLPEAQLDRFMFKLLMSYPDAAELHQIALRTTGSERVELSKVLESSEDVLRFRDLIRQVPMEESVRTHAVELLQSTHPTAAKAPQSVKRFVRYGASPRGLQAMILAGKIYALLEGRYHVAKADIDRALLPALRHRLLLNFEGEAEGLSIDTILKGILHGEN